MRAGTLSLVASEEPALALVARLLVMVAAYHRLLGDEQSVAPDPGLGHAANYLYMLWDERPGEGPVRALETYLNTVSDQGINASTFAARVMVARPVPISSPPWSGP